MATGVRKLRKIQLGRESTAGTEVDATTLWRGTGTIDDQTEVQIVEENIGYLSGVDRTVIPMVGAALDLDETPATFEQVLATAGTVGAALDSPGELEEAFLKLLKKS